ncbi:MAG: phosphoenolpyruvate carboxykinase (ATP) [Candidatus Sumerlaeia bacterium]|nr:phosphoenolpyruvate carboxykinase (ATP) [Candidatus Sumerlaeia bacterium]
MQAFLRRQGIQVSNILRNLSPAELYPYALGEPGTILASNGAIIAYSGARTGRSPKDKRVVKEPSSEANIWWGKVNIPFEPASFAVNREMAIGFLNTRDHLYVVDGFAGWDPKHRIKVRTICTRAYHALFMHNMLIRPTDQELAEYGDPDWVIYNAGQMPACPSVPGVTGNTSVALSFASREFVILGSEYAGEMKKGVFTVLNYLLPLSGALPMHCSANEGAAGDVALFFGLSGTGKTTLSADPKRALIGDDEHGWTNDGVFNFEGGCYAKTINLTREKEPEIYDAIKFGSILENVPYDAGKHDPDYTSAEITENTRCAYPIEYIPNAKIPCVAGHPKNIVFLTCDAFGVLPPVARLDGNQAMYHFISGYTAKVAGTEVGVTEPEATFSACFGAAFMVWHPTVYAELLKKKMQEHDAKVWLVNTGWSGGSYGVGSRIKLAYTRAIIDAILDGHLDNAPMRRDEVFGFDVVTRVPEVPSEILDPKSLWKDHAAFEATEAKLANLFVENFKKYAPAASAELMAASPKVGSGV